MHVAATRVVMLSVPQASASSAPSASSSMMDRAGKSYRRGGAARCPIGGRTASSSWPVCVSVETRASSTTTKKNVPGGRAAAAGDFGITHLDEEVVANFGSGTALYYDSGCTGMGVVADPSYLRDVRAGQGELTDFRGMRASKICLGALHVLIKRLGGTSESVRLEDVPYVPGALNLIGLAGVEALGLGVDIPPEGSGRPAYLYRLRDGSREPGRRASGVPEESWPAARPCKPSRRL